MAEFKSIHTAFGLAAMTEAEVTGIPINLTHMAVGDGLGNPITPNESMTTLVREMYRSTINRVYKPDPSGQPNLFVAELVVPATEGGFTMREVGVFDDDGNLFVVGNLPDTYKPVDTEGAFADTVVRVAFVTSNADVVTIVLDPNVAVATQAWIANNVTACTILPGGTTGQFLKKISNACGDVEWSSLDDLNVVVDIVEEEQTLSTSQTQVDWAVVTTNGLSVYIEGVRLPMKAGTDGWQKAAAPNDVTRIILGQSYPNGTKIVGVQNEPLGAITDPLAKDQNLADVPDKAAARTNLSVYSKAEVDARAKQPGDIFYTASSTAPARSMKANGAAVSRIAYADLYAVIGTTYGAGDGFNTFNLPDGRAEFIRGLDDGRGIDIGRALGSWQDSQNRAHEHLLQIVGTSGGGFGIETMDRRNGSGTIGAAAMTSNNKAISSGGGEARPRNIAFLCCIAY